MHPTSFGRFVIIKEIGKGAMGQVFLADDPKIDRRVAIKTVVLPQGTSAAGAREAGERFVREAQAAGKLLHPNIVTIFDVGEENGVSFIAMEYIEGESLDRHARPGTLLPLGRVLDVVAQTAAALDYAHIHNVVHRDIKPANLMVLPDGTVKVTDFGLAKNPEANLTQSGVLLGTPSYMSPEQIQGIALDGRSDLFSLGVVLYELLTGVRPFEAESISTIIYRILYEDARPPAAHNPALPPEVNLVLEKALAKSPDKRYATGNALAADLRKAFASLPPESLAVPLAGVQPAYAGMAAASSRPTGPTLRNERDRRRPTAPPGTRRPATDPRVPRSTLPAAGQPPPAATLIAHHPAKLIALFATLALAIVTFPRWANRHEPGPEIRAARPRLPAGGEAVSSAALGGGPQQVAIAVETIPHGATVSLDSIPLAEPRVVLSLADPQPHDIAARAGCMEAVAEMTAEDLASFDGPLVMELRPRREKVQIASQPIGARIAVNGRDTGEVTPAAIEIDACEERTIALSKAGYRRWEKAFTREDDFAAMVETLGGVSLSTIPMGTVLVETPATYEVAIHAGGRQVGRAGSPFDLTEGRHQLTFVNRDLFVKETAPVRVVGGRTVTTTVTLPGLGLLTVQASPGNCKVFVDGEFLDATPVLGRSIAAGGHVVRVVYVPDGSSREETVVVKEGEEARVMVRF
jgi:hypothetical protein